jgi:hypothetical protein
MGLALGRMIEYGGPLLYHGSEDEERSSIRRAESSVGFSARWLADARHHPQSSPDGHFVNLIENRTRPTELQL